MQDKSRRQFLKTAGGTALGVLAGTGAGVLGACASPVLTDTEATAEPVAPTSTSAPTEAPTEAPAATAEAIEFPWPYETLDPVAAAERAYAAYYEGGCMYGAFEGVVGELREKIGAPYDTFPAAMMRYGGGGVAGWGTLCGTLNGVAAAIYLVHEPKVANPIINELFAWYGAESLPSYKPKEPKFTEIASTVADSQLCHQSVSIWCTATGFKVDSKERAERCAWLTASVVEYTVRLLNDQAAGSFAATHAIPDDVKGCVSCHGKEGMVGNVHNANASSCMACHDELGEKHP